MSVPEMWKRLFLVPSNQLVHPMPITGHPSESKNIAWTNSAVLLESGSHTTKHTRHILQSEAEIGECTDRVPSQRVRK